MNIYKSRQWLSDVDETIDNFPDLLKLAKKTVLITGATGLIGSSIVDIMMRFNEKNKGNEINVIAAGRLEQKFKIRFAQYVNVPQLTFVQYNADRKIIFDTKCDYIIHGASNTFPNAYVSEAVETMSVNFSGMKNLLDYALLNDVKRVVYISSSEVYGKKDGNFPFKENDYGYVDLLNPRSSYAVSKRAAETLCISYSSEYGIKTMIVRPGHIYGPTARLNDNRISSLWTFAAAQGKDIVMKSDGSQVRSYCYCLDCASAILKVLINGENCHAYNISHSNAIISIREMAQILARVGGVELRSDLPTKEEKTVFNPMRNSSLDSSSLEKLGWKGLFDAERGFLHTVTILKEIEN